MKRALRSITITATALLTVLGASATFAQTDALPRDVNPQSRNRLPLPNLDNASARSKQWYDRSMASFSGVPPKGPSMRMDGSSVQSALDLQMLSPLGLSLSQIPILLTGRELDQPYDWSLHEMQALSVSLDPTVIDVIRRNLPVTKLGAKEAVIIQLGRELFRTHKLSPATYARALRVLGQPDLVDAVGLMADYTSVSASLTAFNQQMPPGFKQFLPLPFTLPNDIHPDSRSRLSLLPSTPTPPGVLYGRPMVPQGTGPGEIGRHGGGAKSLASIARRDIDLAILVTARENRSQYDWTVNELAAMKDGLEPKVIDVIRNRKPTAGLAEKDASMIEFGRELFANHNVTAATYARAVNNFGEAHVVNLVAVMGQHAGEEIMLAAFDQHLPEGQAPLCCRR
jgi:4-carboxymuconolactone decarboxylase